MSEPPRPRGDEPAPRGVCARWMGTSPCGALATVHYIWNEEMRNGPLCPRHDAEVAAVDWSFIGRHPYGPDCRAGSVWFEAADECRPAPRIAEGDGE